MRSTHDGRQGWSAVAGAVHVNIPRFGPSTASRGFGHPTAPHQLGAAPMKRAHRPRSAQFHAHLRSARLVMRLAAFTSALALILWAAWPGTHAQASPCPRLVVQRPMLHVMPCNVTWILPCRAMRTNSSKSRAPGLWLVATPCTCPAGTSGRRWRPALELSSSPRPAFHPIPPVPRCVLQLLSDHDGAGEGGGGWEGEVASLGRAVRVMMVSIRAARPVELEVEHSLTPQCQSMRYILKFGAILHCTVLFFTIIYAITPRTHTLPQKQNTCSW